MAPAVDWNDNRRVRVNIRPRLAWDVFESKFVYWQPARCHPIDVSHIHVIHLANYNENGPE